MRIKPYRREEREKGEAVNIMCVEENLNTHNVTS